MAIAAHDGADRADQLIAVTTRLTTLVSAEIDALRQGKLDASSRDWQEKEKLAHAYRLEIAQIRQNPALLDGASPQQKSALMQAVDEFNTLLHTHAAAISGQKEVTEGLVRAISEEIASSRAAPKGYGATGQMAPPRDASGTGISTNLKI